MRHTLRSKNGFTLMEILVVLAISIILMGLVLAPVVQSFNMMRRARAMADAQDAARAAMEQLSREIGEAMFVYDNTTGPVTVVSPGSGMGTPLNEGTIQLPVRQADNSITWFTLPNAKIDLILPKITMHCLNPAHPAGQSRDYPRGEDAWPPCPVCQSTNVEAKPTVPLQREKNVVRYFLGLRYNDPSVMPPTPLATGAGYFGWKSPWSEGTELGEENQVVLYRAEFDPTDDTLFPKDMSVAQRLQDPIFFYRPDYCRKWAEKAQVVGVGQFEDLMTAVFAPSGNVTSVDPCVTFRFAAVDNDPFAGTFSQDKSFEYPDAVPTVYEASYGYWTSGEGISVYRTAQDSNGNDVTIEYTTEYVPVGGVNHLMIMKRTAPGDPGTPEFDITDYLTKLADGNLTAITKPGGGAPEVAFTFDYAVLPDPSNPGGNMVALTFNRGMVNFALTPPRPVGQTPAAILKPYEINKDFLTAFSNDRGSARRMRTLPTFPNGSSPDPSYVANARMVPGSERVVGPDMTPPVTNVEDSPGEVHFVSRSNASVTYERVPLALGDPGINQYKIDYDTGVVYFSSVYDQNLPDQYAKGGRAEIDVDYKIYFNQPGDVVKGSYTTKDLVTVHLEMRMFDPESGKPHAVDLNSSIKVRNALR